MKYLANSEGDEFYNKWRRQFRILLFTAPIFLTIVSVLFWMGRLDTSQIYLSIFLILMLILYLSVTFVGMLKRLNRTVNEILIDKDMITIKTYRAFFLKSMIYKTAKHDIKHYPRTFQVTRSEKREGSVILTHESEFILFHSFFEEDCLKEINVIPLEYIGDLK